MSSNLLCIRALALYSLAIALACFGLVFAPLQAHAAQSSKPGTPLVAAQEVTAAEGEGALAEEPVLSGATVQARPFMQHAGWKSWVAQGKTAGSSKGEGLRRIQLRLASLSEVLAVDSSIHYSVYDRGKGWTKAYANGKTAGRKAVPVQAVKVWLTGTVAKNYDVLYRVKLYGRGWQPWVKNKAKAGAAGSGTYATAIQVKLSPKTQEALGAASTAVGVQYAARMKSSGWQGWVAGGKTSGKAKGNIIVDGFALALDAGNQAGGVKYKAYIQGSKWSQGWKTSGKVVGTKGKRIEALQVKLTGAIAKAYDVYYRTYVYGYGWLDWAKNGATSGSTGLNLAAAAVQVKLVAKGGKAPKATTDTTVNLKRTSLNGIDISSWQPAIKVGNTDADFVIVKATGGKSYTNPYFKMQANATLKAGKLLGLYHFARERGRAGSAVQEADYFVDAVGPYIGRAVLVLDWEADALLLGPKWAKTFLDRVYKKTGVRPLIYMSASYTNYYDWSKVAGNYKLWVAQYPNMNRTGFKTNAWPTWPNGFGAWDGPTMYQYSSTGRISGTSYALDLDIFYGKAADWNALATPAK